MYEEIRKEAAAAAQEICQVAKLQKGQILVVGCSTSEVTGHTVGSDSSPAIGQAIYEGIQQVLAPKGIYLAAQCCEHLNRAIIVEAEAAGQAELCNVVPQPKAGGSFATAAYHGFQHPVALEEIRADAGLDIGGTLIGMDCVTPGSRSVVSISALTDIRVLPFNMDILKKMLAKDPDPIC